MTVGKPFAMDKTDTSIIQMTRLQAFYDFWLFIGLSTAYIIQVGIGRKTSAFSLSKVGQCIQREMIPEELFSP